MTAPPTPGPAAPRTCGTCGAPVTGRFCSQCGGAALLGPCGSCGTALTAGARFCHRCGAPVRGTAASAGRERTAWIVAGLAVVVALLAIIWRPGSGFRAAVPDMANAGNAADATAGGGPAPDISSMTPRERFDRLWNRIMRASESGDTATVSQFTPMALQAYGMLDAVDTDARYHAAMLDLLAGDTTGARALADTVALKAPGHLFGYMIRAELAERTSNTAALNRSYADFLSHYDQEIRAGRTEYADHGPGLDAFRTRARAALGK